MYQGQNLKAKANSSTLKAKAKAWTFKAKAKATGPEAKAKAIKFGLEAKAWPRGLHHWQVDYESRWWSVRCKIACIYRELAYADGYNWQ